MKDRRFIEDMLNKGNEARGKVNSAFKDLSSAQLNWKPVEESWSIGQCLDHLVIADCMYFPALQKITEGKFEMSFWQSWSPLSGLFGRVIENSVLEKHRRKIKTPKIFEPSESHVDAGILERFHKHLDTLLGYTAACSTIDIDKIHITSPVYKMVTYSLRRTFSILYQHEHRHINQALKVKASKEFPV